MHSLNWLDSVTGYDAIRHQFATLRAFRVSRNSAVVPSCAGSKCLQREQKQLGARLCFKYVWTGTINCPIRGVQNMKHSEKEI
jgi:hypothetical protein